MVDCHHKECCGCDRQAEVVAEATGADGVTRFNVCAPHHDLLVQEAARKNVIVTSLIGFRCPLCGMVSYNPNDLREGYCGNCHDWTGAL